MLDSRPKKLSRCVRVEVRPARLPNQLTGNQVGQEIDQIKLGQSVYLKILVKVGGKNEENTL